MKQRFQLITDGIVQILPFNESHLSHNYVSWLNDKEVVRYSEQRHYVHTLKSCQIYYEQQLMSNNYFLAIELILNNQKKHVGNLGISIDIENKIADLSIIIGDKSTWGNGVGSRAWNLALKFILCDLKFRMVTAGTMEVNAPMIKLMNRSGMIVDGILPSRFIFEGLEVGMVAASITKINFINNQKKL